MSFIKKVSKLINSAEDKIKDVNKSITTTPSTCAESQPGLPKQRETETEQDVVVEEETEIETETTETEEE